MKIKNIIAREILDSRGNPTVEVDVLLDKGVIGRAAVPSGASTGSKEALELRDGDKTRYGGKGVLKAVDNVNKLIYPELRGFEADDQATIDKILKDLDGTINKSKLGANAILGVSIAVAKASAQAQGRELFQYLGGEKATVIPTPFMNIVNGGAHASNSIEFQEFMIVPAGFISFREALRAGSEVYNTLGKLLKSKGLATTVGDEGGFAPNISSQNEVLDYIFASITKAGYEGKVFLALDVAASEFYEDGKYVFKKSTKEVYSAEKLIALYKTLSDTYPIVSIEDGLAEGDWTGWQELTEKMRTKVQLVGDDIFVTNKGLIEQGIAKGVANSVLIKLNQIGTLTETIEAVKVSKSAGYSAMISHRSGETEDTTIADLAVALEAGMIKTGAPCRTDRVAKYNRLLRIEETLGAKAKFAGTKYIKNFSK